jgi:hypothetical protein
MMNNAHWTQETPMSTGWYWYKDRSHRPVMLRIDENSVVDSKGEFVGIQAVDLVGDWWSAQIKTFV